MRGVPSDRYPYRDSQSIPNFEFSTRFWLTTERHLLAQMGPYRREASTLRHGPPPAELPQTGSWPSRLSESHSLVNVWLTARSSATPVLRFIRRSRKPPTRSRRDSDSPSAFARKDRKKYPPKARHLYRGRCSRVPKRTRVCWRIEEYTEAS